MGEGKTGATRLDGLVDLLRSGTNSSVRKMAASQIGEVVAAHPAEVRPVLRRIRKLLRMPAWETRIAAGQALAAIASQTPRYVPKDTSKFKMNDFKSEAQIREKKEDVVVKTDGCPPTASQDRVLLVFEKLDIVRVLEGGALLFGSSGEEYKVASVDIAQQRARLKADLGLDDKFGMEEDNFLGVKDEDLNVAPPSVPDNVLVKRKSADEIFAELAGDRLSKLSAREKNRLRRQAKKQARQQPTDLSANGQMAEFSAPQKKGPQPSPGRGGEDSTKSAESSEALDDEAEEIGVDPAGWEFQPTCEVLKTHLLETRWETRHGAAVGLREILKYHASSAGRYSSNAELGDAENLRWLEDTICRLLCVLALDRFGDFVGDAVVAPVRETAAMAISVAAKDMPPQRIDALLCLMLKLLESARQRSKWEVRHAALLGVRYLLAVRNDLAKTLIPLSFDAVSSGLVDEDDDVRAVAADALFPVTDSMVRILNHQKISGLVVTLWDALLELDDISASTGAVLRLLAKLTRTPVPAGMAPMWLDRESLNSLLHDQMNDRGRGPPLGNEADQHILVELIPRLWPFLRHHSVFVRRAAMSLVEALFDASDESHFAQWIQSLCSEALERIFRNIVLESDGETLEVSKKVWSLLLSRLGKSENDQTFLCSRAAPLLRGWLALASHETRGEAAAFDKARSTVKSSRVRRKTTTRRVRRNVKAGQRAANNIEGATAVEGPYEGAEMQHNAADALGMLAKLWLPGDPSLANEVALGLTSHYATARRVACDVCRMWQVHTDGQLRFPAEIKECLLNEMEGTRNSPIAELGLSTGSLFSDTSSLLDAVLPAMQRSADTSLIRRLADQGKLQTASGDVISLSRTAVEIRPRAISLARDLWPLWENYVKENKVKKRRRDAVDSLRLRVLAGIGYVSTREASLRTSLSAAAAAALTFAERDPLPKAVGPYIKSLMASVKSSENPRLQNLAANSLAKLTVRLAERSSHTPISKLLKNLFKYVTIVVPRREENEKQTQDVPSSQELPLVIAKRGAAESLRAMCRLFGIDIFAQLPWLWEFISQPASAGTEIYELLEMEAEKLNAHKDALNVLKTVVGEIDRGVHDVLCNLIPWIIRCATAGGTSLGDEAAACLAEFVAAIPTGGMEAVIKQLMPLLTGVSQDSSANAQIRRGAAKAVCTVVDRLGTSIIPYAAFLVVPMMQRMVDDDPEVRQLSAKVFGTIVRLIPLEKNASDDAYMSASMSAERKSARRFLNQLLGTEPRAHYEMPVKIGDGISLRKYQQECLDWLAFLNSYGLHGALCDDMGLGKTLMTLCIVAGTYNESQGHKGKQEGTLPSLVVCPSTIVAHWAEECARFFGHVLSPVVRYCGSPKVRAGIRSTVNFAKMALIITSYDTLSKDVTHFTDTRFSYVVLDEGHVIKNPKTKNSQAVRKLSAQHRLILTGTPIQNSVIELWSMFDFLMPGFLGTERAFKDLYAKPIIASRDAKCPEHDREKGMLAMESLHRQVLPFILRRVKDDVLSELPPKIIQDYHCDMTCLQIRLYEDFAKHVISKGSSRMDVLGGGAKKKRENNAFQALQYLRRLCSHPRLVLTEKHPEYWNVMNELRASGGSLHDISASSKLVALQNLLIECGIGDADCTQESGGHRVLIFAQLKAMLDIVESDLFRAHMPSVTYLRLDGSVETSKRQNIVTRFNSDPTIDCLLLTTQVGGLGLNLTGADTVIFLEHDWNPTKDLQAMDRAHRIGQKRTVNVYRLVTRGTLEEKILGIQKFKTHIANTVVNRENSALQNMNTDELLSLFQLDVEGSDQVQPKGTGKNKENGLKSILENVGELWDESQYNSEYDMNEFLANLDIGKPE